MKLACEFVINLYGKVSIAYHRIYLFAKLEELTSYVKASGLSAERSVNRETLTLALTIQVLNVLVSV